MGEEAYDLRHFGWDNCIIPANLKDIHSHIPSYTSLKTLRSPTLFNRRDTYFPHKFYKCGDDVYMPAFEKGVLHTDGGYADIYKARRAIFVPEGSEQKGNVRVVRKGDFQEICIKEVKLCIRPSENAASPTTRRCGSTAQRRRGRREGCVCGGGSLEHVPSSTPSFPRARARCPRHCPSRRARASATWPVSANKRGSTSPATREGCGTTIGASGAESMAPDRVENRHPRTRREPSSASA